MKYRLKIEGLLDTGFTNEATFSYEFQEAYTGTLTLIVTDGELESTIEAEINIREKPDQERVEIIQELINSLDEDTSYIRSRKRVWLQLARLLDDPVLERLPGLKTHLIQILERDIQRSLWLNERLQRGWWWRRRVLISDENVETLEQIKVEIKRI